ncbi:5-formyltetrahydrofolate cyclo-ligase [Flavobacterium dankookense]|uniref:5-formyltetrahydrofolate cyclo-ligase n=1 Tax=Flavobacterium dankookense TaxID=706186 RepID=A0A4V3CSD5_9FLAO|nr:5-formyltetrahydrofolate cyclo-ligase [Flavobacterium dankookense]TDP60252.1 5-formyltetrahydrofolate cyclo-ligase [Flavobacterium dankookense]
MNKTDLRSKYKALRNQLSEEEIEDKSLAIANRLLQFDIWEKTYFHLFLTIEEQKEVETEFILQILAGKDREIVVSKTNFETREMTNYLLTDNTKFQKNEYNIFEPVDGIEVPVAKLDVVFVPLLAYDKNGNRVGYGKGFYDNLLTKCREDVVKIGLSFFEPEDSIDDVSAADVRLDFCVTPNGISSF